MDPKYTEAELASLTPDERSALEADDASEDDAAALQAIADEAGDDEGDEKAETTDEKAEGEKADTTDAKADDEKSEESDEPAAELQADRTFKAEAPADAAEQRKTLRAEDAAAFKQLMEGEIEPEAYAAIKDRVNDELEALTRAEVTADVSSRIAAQSLANDWKKAVNEAVATAKKDGIDYMGKQQLADFDSLLKLYSKNAADNGMKDDNLEASMWALEEANKMMRKIHGVAKPAAPAVKTEEKPAAQRHNLPNIGKLPAADRAPINDDIMSKIATLDGEDLEKYMATLSSKEIDRIMASS